VPTPQRLRQRQVLRLGLRRQARGVSGEKRERRFVVLAVFGQIEMHPADQIPGRMQTLEEILQRLLRLLQPGAERRVEFRPKRT